MEIKILSLREYFSKRLLADKNNRRIFGDLDEKRHLLSNFFNFTMFKTFNIIKRRVSRSFVTGTKDAYVRRKILSYIQRVPAVMNSRRLRICIVSKLRHAFPLHSKNTHTPRAITTGALRENKDKKKGIEANGGTDLLTCGPGSPGSPFFPFFPLFPGGPGSPGGPITGTNNKSIPRDALERKSSRARTGG